MNDVASLYRAYSSYHWFWKWLLPRDLTTALEDYGRAEADDPHKIQAAIAVCRTYFNISFFFKWLYVALREFSHSNTIRSISTLEKANLLNDEQTPDLLTTLITHENLSGLAITLTSLEKANLLNDEQAPDLLSTLITHENLSGLAITLTSLQKDGLLTAHYLAGENLTALLAYKRFFCLCFTLDIFQKNLFFNNGQGQDHFTTILTHRNLDRLAFALFSLQKANLLNNEQAPDILTTLLTHENLPSLAQALDSLRKANWFNNEQREERFILLLTHENLPGLAQALVPLQKANLLSNEHIVTTVFPHQDLTNLGQALALLQNVKRKSSEECEEIYLGVLSHNNLPNLAEAMILLQKEKLSITQCRALLMQPTPLTFANSLLNYCKEKTQRLAPSQSNLFWRCRHPVTPEERLQESKTPHL